MAHQFQDKYVVRMPAGMRDKIREMAAINHRSMNAEIIHHITNAYSSTETKKADARS